MTAVFGIYYRYYFHILMLLTRPPPRSVLHPFGAYIEVTRINSGRVLVVRPGFWTNITDLIASPLYAYRFL